MEAGAEKGSLGTFERFLYWLFIPFVFTVVLVAVLLSLFDYNIKNELQRFGHTLPLVGSFIPEPKVSTPPGTTPDPATAQANKQAQELAAAKQQLAALQNQVTQDEASSKQKDQTIKDLQTQITKLNDQAKAKAASDQEYLARIQDVAGTYAKMNPSKSAPLLENLTTTERILVLSQMKQEDRVNILEKMDPKIAAEASIALKDVVPVRDQEIAALQERIKAYENAIPKAGQKLSTSDIATTYSSMPPKSAATILLQMQTTSPDKVLEVLEAVNSTARSSILAAMADLDKATTAQISAKLAP